MKPGHFDLPIIWRGSTYQDITFTWLDANGNPMNLTGWSPQARSLNINFHPQAVDTIHGITKISLTSAETAALPLGVEAWDWRWVDVAHNKTTNPLISGFVEVKEPASNAPIPPPST